jgi:hypothetical protein
VDFHGFPIFLYDFPMVFPDFPIVQGRFSSKGNQLTEFAQTPQFTLQAHQPKALGEGGRFTSNWGQLLDGMWKQDGLGHVQGKTLDSHRELL